MGAVADHGLIVVKTDIRSNRVAVFRSKTVFFRVGGGNDSSKGGIDETVGSACLAHDRYRQIKLSKLPLRFRIMAVKPHARIRVTAGAELYYIPEDIFYRKARICINQSYVFSSRDINDLTICIFNPVNHCEFINGITGAADSNVSRG